MIVVVSGLPRSGTSLMMQMLAAGGLPPLTDGRRTPDVNNPRGYLEWEPIRNLRRVPACIAQAEGRAVKVVSFLLPWLPPAFSYKVIFLDRPLDEIAASQEAMIKRLGTRGAELEPEAAVRALEEHMEQVNGWFRRNPGIPRFSANYNDLLGECLPEIACAIREFLGVPLDIVAMISQVDGSLYRQRRA
jgi:hypothetical protein